MYNFDTEKVTDAILKWIKKWFDQNGKDSPAVIGISGGKDSSVVAALCVKALGKDRVFGVLMPKGKQSDIDYSKKLCEFLGIKNVTIDISQAVEGVTNGLNGKVEMTKQAKINLPARIRMATVYAVSQSMNGRVANTCNLSEDFVGYSTRYGDSVGDFSPLSSLTVTEVIKVGNYLGLPEMFTKKPPSDGLTGKTDEQNLGFTYAELDKFIREGIEPKKDVKEKILTLNKQNAFKLKLMPSFNYDPNKN